VSDGVSEIVERVAESVLSGACHRLVLSRPRGDRHAGGVRRADRVANRVADRVTARPLELASGSVFQFTHVRGRGETHENLAPSDAAARIAEWFPAVYRDLHLFGPDGDLSARVSGSDRLKVHTGPATTSLPESLSHDRSKRHLIPDGEPCAFLEAIGVMAPGGRVRASRMAKFRQVNRFLELVDDCVPSLPTDGPLRVVDFGSGKSYLTFALHHLLGQLRGREVRIVGVEREAEVIDTCRNVAHELGLDDVTFCQGEISSWDPVTTIDAFQGEVDLAVSLHACDTATDDALARAVAWNAAVILAVPCCQHEASEVLSVDGLETVHRHGILHERLSAIVTDALRAEALEVCGYRTGVVEFIDMEHTAKNLLLRATRREPGEADRRRRVERAREYRRLRVMLDTETTRLEQQLGKPFTDLVADATGS